jgi:POT family proton-dependent oligopeptide transporter
MAATTVKHPKGLYFVFSISIAERFGYYGMRALFVLYMINALMMDKDLSALIYGNYTGLVYLTPLSAAM